jgi:hypothetical protein
MEILQGVVYRMPIRMRKAVTIFTSALVVLALELFVFTLQHEVPKPDTWSANVKIYRRALSGETRVFDAESGKFLFAFKPEYDLNVRPIKLERLDQNHWEVILENPTTK